MTQPVEQLTAIEEKLAELVKHSSTFTPEEAAKIREALEFVKVFRGDATVLKRIETLFTKFEGAFFVTKWGAGLLIGTVVVLSNWERFLATIRSFLAP